MAARTTLLAAAVALLVGGSACGPAHHQAAALSAPPTPTQLPSTGASSGAPITTHRPGATSPTQAPASPRTTGHASASAAPPSGRSGSPGPAQTPIPLSATVTPSCVQRGSSVRISVTTVPKAAVGYQAWYADGKSGAPAPMGQGYGGNAGNVTDGNGHYSDTWVVAPNAPVGPGRVQVLASHQGGYAQIYVPWRVVAAGGHC